MIIITAKNGIFDLGGSEPGKEGFSIEGIWEIYPGMLLDPDDFIKQNYSNDLNFIAVPGHWKNSRIEDINSGKGYATYRIRIINGFGKTKKALTVSGISSAYKLWINGELLQQKGIVDSSEEAGKQFLYIHGEEISPFYYRNGTAEIVLQVLNPYFDSGGIEDAPLLLDGESALGKKYLNDIINIIVTGMLFCVSIYNIFLSFFRKKDPAALYLGLFSLVWTIYLINLFSVGVYDSGIYSRIRYLIDHITVILNVPLCYMTLKSLFPEECSNRIMRPFALTILPACFIIPSLFAGFEKSEFIMSVFYLICIIFITYYAYLLIKVVYHRREGAAFFFIGFLSFFATAVNDMLYTLKVINTGIILQYGLLVFSLSSTMVVTRKFARALIDVEILTVDLANRMSAGTGAETIMDNFTIRCGSNVYSLRFSEIIYISSKSKNIALHTTGRDLELPVLMKEISERLPADIFMRIHKKYIINTSYIYNLHHVISGRYKVRLKDYDDTELPVGPSFLNTLRKKIL